MLPTGSMMSESYHAEVADGVCSRNTRRSADTRPMERSFQLSFWRYGEYSPLSISNTTISKRLMSSTARSPECHPSTLLVISISFRSNRYLSWQNIGCLAAYPFSPYVSDGLGRRFAVGLGAFIMCAATVLQTASHSVGMFIGARWVFFSSIYLFSLHFSNYEAERSFADL